MFKVYNVIQLEIYILSQILFYYKLLQDINIVPCAVQCVFIIYFLYSTIY